MDAEEAIAPSCEKQTIGIRPGENIHEEMVTSSDSISSIDLEEYYAILASYSSVQSLYEKVGHS